MPRFFFPRVLLLGRHLRLRPPPQPPTPPVMPRVTAKSGFCTSGKISEPKKVDKQSIPLSNVFNKGRASRLENPPDLSPVPAPAPSDPRTQELINEKLKKAETLGEQVLGDEAKKLMERAKTFTKVYMVCIQLWPYDDFDHCQVTYLKLLISVLGSEDAARDSLLWSFSVPQFVARLTDSQAKQLAAQAEVVDVREVASELTINLKAFISPGLMKKASLEPYKYLECV